MDESVIRRHLEEIKSRLKGLEEEREVLVTLVHGYEGWLRLKNPSSQLKIPISTKEKVVMRKPPSLGGTPKGTMSLRSAVLQVIREARGAPVHAKEIYLRTQDLGARTDGKNPPSVVDLTAYSLAKRGEPIEKVGPWVWRYKDSTLEVEGKEQALTPDIERLGQSDSAEKVLIN